MGSKSSLLNKLGQHERMECSPQLHKYFPELVSEQYFPAELRPSNQCVSLFLQGYKHQHALTPLRELTRQARDSLKYSNVSVRSGTSLTKNRLALNERCGLSGLRADAGRKPTGWGQGVGLMVSH